MESSQDKQESPPASFLSAAEDFLRGVRRHPEAYAGSAQNVEDFLHGYLVALMQLANHDLDMVDLRNRNGFLSTKGLADQGAEVQDVIRVYHDPIRTLAALVDAKMSSSPQIMGTRTTASLGSGVVNLPTTTGRLKVTSTTENPFRS